MKTKMLIGAVLFALILGVWWMYEFKSITSIGNVGEVKTQVFDGRQQVLTDKPTGTVVVSITSIGVRELKTQVFDGRQQVSTDKPTGTVVVKGRLY
ncbi:MAG: hypothetical protein V1801_01185 [Candidatus Falkowbacteria bacterium]